MPAKSSKKTYNVKPTANMPMVMDVTLPDPVGGSDRLEVFINTLQPAQDSLFILHLSFYTRSGEEVLHVEMEQVVEPTLPRAGDVAVLIDIDLRLLMDSTQGKDDGNIDLADILSHLLAQYAIVEIEWDEGQYYITFECSQFGIKGITQALTTADKEALLPYLDLSSNDDAKKDV